MTLLNAGTNSNSKMPVWNSKFGEVETPVAFIIHAAEKKRLTLPDAQRIVHRMIQKGANLNDPATSSYTPTGWAFFRFDQLGSAFADPILENGGAIDFKSDCPGHSTGLGTAIRYCDGEAIDYLVFRGASIDQEPVNGVTPYYTQLG